MNQICSFDRVVYYVENNTKWVILAIDNKRFPFSYVGEECIFTAPEYIFANTLNRYQKERL